MITKINSSSVKVWVLGLLLSCAPQLAIASEVDSEFIRGRILRSDCQLDSSLFVQEFSDAVDRLNQINPKLVTYIRSTAYKRTFFLKCDLPNDARGIYFLDGDQSIHMWSVSQMSWITVSNFFHEFLHFVGIKIDLEYHNHPDLANIVEVDSVYACHMSVFPQLFKLANMDPLRIDAAKARCALAEIE